MSRVANFLWMLPPDSSAARMPLGCKTRVLAMSSRLLGLLCSAAKDWSWSRLRAELSLACSTLARARRKLSSMELPRIKLPRIVAEAIE